MRFGPFGYLLMQTVDTTYRCCLLFCFTWWRSVTGMRLHLWHILCWQCQSPTILQQFFQCLATIPLGTKPDNSRQVTVFHQKSGAKKLFVHIKAFYLSIFRCLTIAKTSPKFRILILSRILLILYVTVLNGNNCTSYSPSELHTEALMYDKAYLTFRLYKLIACNKTETLPAGDSEREFIPLSELLPFSQSLSAQYKISKLLNSLCVE